MGTLIFRNEDRRNQVIELVIPDNLVVEITRHCDPENFDIDRPPGRTPIQPDPTLKYRIRIYKP